MAAKIHKENDRALTKHERDVLLPQVVKFATEHALDNGKLPTTEEIRVKLNCASASAGILLRFIDREKLVPLPPKECGPGGETTAGFGPTSTLKEQNEITDDTWSISLPKTRIHTLEELIAFFKIDTEVWEVERFVANKWEMGYKDDEGEAHTVPLYQVKAYLRRKLFNNIIDYAKENARLRSNVIKMQRDLRVAREYADLLGANHAGYDELLANIRIFSEALGDLQLPKQRIMVHGPDVSPAVSLHHTEDAVMMLSDTHFGDVIRSEDTSGFPEFDLVIAANRMGYIIEKAKRVLAIHRAAYPLKKLYIWLGGDIGNGILHDSPNSNCLFPPAQVHFGYHMLKFAIEDLLTLTIPDEHGRQVIEDITLLFTVGNHMRLDEKMPHKYQAQRTLDWLIYQFLIERFKTHPKVLIHETMSPFIFETIRGHRHLFAHGMQVGYRNSPEVQNRAISRFINLARALFDSPEWRRKNGLENETFSRACIGDIHVPIRYPRFVSNGSLNGQNELGVNWTMEPIPAAQWLWGVSNKHQETFHYLLECTKIQREPEHMNPYGDFAVQYMERVGRGG